ncbi:MAG: DNA translocase FtsK 4TM domain-containing protein [Deltaproteobacteria bacterium]|nr:DNA translocase FtsK 4TM domain-containing protein [Deltaproteobacteria bacterium]
MAYSKSVRRTPPSSHRKEIFGILFFALGFFISLCLFSYSPTDPGLNSASNVSHIGNLGGVIGAYLSDVLFTGLGLCAYVVGAVFFLLSMLKFKGQSVEIKLKEIICYTLVLITVATLLQIHFPMIHIMGQSFTGGGILGAFFSQFLIHYFNKAGAEVITLTALILSFMSATQIKISGLAINAWRLLKYFGGHFMQWFRVSMERGRKMLAVFSEWMKDQFHSMFGKEALAEMAKEEEKKAGDEVEVKIHKTKPAPPALVPALTPVTTTELVKTPELKIYERADAGKKAPAEEQLRFLKITGDGFNPPPLSLLDSDQNIVTPIDEEILKKNAQLLEKKLQDYDVQGKVTEIHPGPVITMYEFEPSAGTKVNKIVNLESDLSLTMGGKSIRIVPHIPGKAALGIEIPNHEREIVWLKEIIGSNAFLKSKSKLTLALGKDTEGRPVATDLTKMPHLLIAGATGAGKSVAINSMIVSMLYKATPQEVRFIMVDPKRLELNTYEGIPHLLMPVVVSPKQAVAALKWALREMERRYRLLADAGTRNISNYNEKIDAGQIQLVPEEEAKAQLEQNKEAICHTGKLYYLVILIDELADMMMIASQEFEETITRLAQMARAAGIHLILATQRPSVDVITGLIKANFPARISFKVSSKHDSRTILDQIGSENLLGAGDMLYMAPSSSGLTRIHGAYVTEGEIARIVSHLKEQGTPVYDTSMLDTPASETAEADDFDEEDNQIYDQAVKLVAETRQASISMIQRRLRIGYNRAARMIEKMEAEGLVGPQDGAKPRQVLVGMGGNQ